MTDSGTLAGEQFHGIIAFIAENSDFDLNEAIARLQRAFPRREVRPISAARERGIAVVAKRWRIWLQLVEGPHVASESREMAEWLASHPRAAEIAGCKRRVEFAGTDIRPASRCHADMLRACRVLSGFGGVVVFDLELGEVMS